MDISRRDFCALGLGLVVLGGCTDGDTGAIQTGSIGGDIAPDAASSQPDAGTAATCSASPTDVGPPSMFVTGTPVYNSTGRFYIVRDSDGIYALTSRCTHEGAVCTVSSSRFRCPRHGALFTFNGAVVSGPVSKPLVHYATCLLPNGHVGVSTTTIVAATVRLVA